MQQPCSASTQGQVIYPHIKHAVYPYQSQALYLRHKVDGSVQEKRNSIANVLVLRLSCINPSKYQQYRAW